jgi:hypothetical protein
MFARIDCSSNGRGVVFRATGSREHGNAVTVAAPLRAEQVAPRVSVSTGHLQSPAVGQRVVHGSPNMLVLVYRHAIPILTREGFGNNHGQVGVTVALQPHVFGRRQRDVQAAPASAYERRRNHSISYSFPCRLIQ